MVLMYSYRKDRSLGGGGVFLAIRDTLAVTEVPSLNTDAELIWAKIKLYNQSPLYICSYYRPPNSDLQSAFQLSDSLNKLVRQNPCCNIILAGDFNLPSIKWDDGQGTISPNPTYGRDLNDVFIDIVNNYNLEQFVYLPSRQNHTLDLVFASRPTLIKEVTIAPGMSDHEIVVFSINCLRASINKKKPHKIFLFHKGDISGLRDQLQQFQQLFIESNPLQNSVEHNWQMLKDAITTATTKHIPTKLSKSRNQLPWINPIIKQKMKKRKHLYDKAKLTNTYDDWNAYKQARNEVNLLLESAHHNYCTRLFEDSSTCKKRFWTYIKSKKKDHTGVAPLNDEGNTYTDAKHKAQILNKQFESVFTNEDVLSIPRLGHSAYPTIHDVLFTTHGIQLLLEKLDPAKAPGPDQLPTRVLKLCAKQIAPVLQVIYSQSLDHGTLPHDWLSANITPVFKKGNRNTPANYRPISLTSISCKVMEHIIFHHIMSHFDSSNILNPLQHGFRPNHSCQTQLVDLIEDIQRSTNDHKQVDLLFLDFSKAFDTVPHKRLLNKLNSYGIQGPIFQWISSWLTKRNQRVVVDGKSSDTAFVKSGVPQGTVLGPLMFLVYINDINESISSSIRLFADDCVVYNTISTLHDAEQLQNDLNNICTWSEKWQMKLNIDKCVLLRCTRSLAPVLHTYVLNGRTLVSKTQHSYLGIVFDSTMSWSPHIQMVSNKATKVLNFVKRNLSSCPINTKTQAYSTLVRSIMEYASPAWDPYYNTDIYRLEKVQRRAARWVLSDYNRQTSITSLLSTLNWSTLQQRRLSSRLTLFYKIIKNQLPITFPSYYLSTQYHTRQYHQDHFIVPQSNTNSHKYSFYPRTIRNWNNLPITLIEATSVNEFMNLLSRHYNHNN